MPLLAPLLPTPEDIITAVNEGGSAFESPSKNQLFQSKISTVMGADVSTLSFDWVMDAIINAPSPVVLDFAVPVAAPVAEVAVAAAPEAAIDEEAVVEEAPPATPQYETGAAVTITVQQPQSNKPDITLEARVGDNLRTTFLSNKDIELHRGLKKKLGNCGGGAQCGFCAVELVDDEGVWPERIEYEATKIGKNGSEKCRLACVNNIVAPCTVRTLQVVMTIWKVTLGSNGRLLMKMMGSIAHSIRLGN